MRFLHVTKFICLPLLLVLSACESKKDDAAEDEDSAGASTVAVGGAGSTSGATSPAAAAKEAATAKLKAADSVSDLKLAGSLKITMPAALSGKKSGSSLNLAQGGLLSQESCQMGQTIDEVVSRMEDIGNFFCHIELESDKLKFGKKYAINMEMKGKQVEFGKIFIDDSKLAAGTLQLGFCSKGEEGGRGANMQLITINGISDNGASGSLIDMGEDSNDEGEHAWHSSISFDMTEKGKVYMIAKQTFDGEGSNYFDRLVEMEIDDAGVSEVALASDGIWENSAFSEIGLARFDNDFGMALYNSAGTHGGESFDFDRVAYFDADGYVAAAGASAQFAAGGKLHVAIEDLPEALGDDFAPDAISGWLADGCEAAAVDDAVVLNPDSPAHQACDGDRSQDDDHINCWDQSVYQSGEMVQQ